MNADVIIPYIAPTLLAILQIVLVWRDWRKRPAEVRQVEAVADHEQGEAVGAIVGAASTLATAQTNTVQSLIQQIAALTDRVAQQEKRIARLDRRLRSFANRIDYLMGGINQLIEQLADLQETPVWKPDNWHPDGEEDASHG